MSKNNKPQSDLSSEYLRKLEKQTSQQKRQEALNILNRGQQRQFWLTTWMKNYQKKFMVYYMDRKQQFLRQMRYGQNKHIIIISVFFLGVCYISWKIEEKYDKMRTRAKSTKSLKTRQVQAENEYIQKMLARNPFEPVPIEEEEKQERQYIFQRAEVEFDTRADLLDIMEQEKGALGDDQIQKL